MKKCPKCQKNMSDSSAFCDKCGTVLEDVVSTKEDLKDISTIPPVSKDDNEVFEENIITESPEELLSNVEKHGKSFFQPVSETSEAEEAPTVKKEKEVKKHPIEDVRIEEDDNESVKEPEIVEVEEASMDEIVEDSSSIPSTIPTKEKKKKGVEKSSVKKTDTKKEVKEDSVAKEAEPTIEDQEETTEVVDEKVEEIEKKEEAEQTKVEEIEESQEEENLEKEEIEESKEEEKPEIVDTEEPEDEEKSIGEEAEEPEEEEKPEVEEIEEPKEEENSEVEEVEESEEEEKTEVEEIEESEEKENSEVEEVDEPEEEENPEVEEVEESEEAEKTEVEEIEEPEEEEKTEVEEVEESEEAEKTEVEEIEEPKEEEKTEEEVEESEEEEEKPEVEEIEEPKEEEKTEEEVEESEEEEEIEESEEEEKTEEEVEEFEEEEKAEEEVEEFEEEEKPKVEEIEEPKKEEKAEEDAEEPKEEEKPKEVKSSKQEKKIDSNEEPEKDESVEEEQSTEEEKPKVEESKPEVQNKKKTKKVVKEEPKKEEIEDTKNNDVEIEKKEEEKSEEPIIEADIESPPDLGPIAEKGTVPVTEPIVESKIEPETVPVTQPVVVPKTEPVTAPKVEQPPAMHPVAVQTPQQPVIQPVSPVVPQAIPTNPVATATMHSSSYSNEVVQEEISDDYDDDLEDIKTKISYIVGIVSIVLSFACMWPIGVIGFIVGFLSKDTSPKRNRALILNAIGIAVGVVAMIIYFSVVQPGKSASNPELIQFYGDGYSLVYSSPWKPSTIADGKTALKYGDENSYFSPVGHTSLDVTVDCDFAKDSCKTFTYNDFYEYWSSTIDDAFVLREESSFYLLKDDIYYATYNYSIKETGEQKGKYYLIISKKKNAVLSFISAGDEENLAALHPNIIKLMETMEIDQHPSQDEKEIKNLDQLSNWYLYSDLRQNTSGKSKKLSGGFRILSDSTSFWVFKNGKFWWYKSENDLNDNYWSGTYTVETGKKGLKSVGLPGGAYEKVIGQAKGKVTADDVYSIVMKPNKIVSGGVDKSKTNIPSGTEWKCVWIIIDHGDDGIEAQVLNVSSNETSYFVKVYD